jgi:hypothetical protein
MDHGIYHKDCAPVGMTRLHFDGEDFYTVASNPPHTSKFGRMTAQISARPNISDVPDWIQTVYEADLLAEGHICDYYIYLDPVSVECYTTRNGLEQKWAPDETENSDTSSSDTSNITNLSDFVEEYATYRGVRAYKISHEFDSLADLKSDVENGCSRLAALSGIGEDTIDRIKTGFQEVDECNV